MFFSGRGLVWVLVGPLLNNLVNVVALFFYLVLASANVAYELWSVYPEETVEESMLSIGQGLHLAKAVGVEGPLQRFHDVGTESGWQHFSQKLVLVGDDKATAVPAPSDSI